MPKKKKEETDEMKAKKILYKYNEVTNTVICTICEKTVNVGRGGIDNYETQHRNSMVCLADKARAENLKKAKGKVQSTLSFTRRPRQTSQTPLTTAPTQSTSTSILASTTKPARDVAEVARSQIHPDPVPEASATTPNSGGKQGCLSVHPFVERLSLLAKGLPSSIPMGTADDQLGCLAEPSKFDILGAAAEDLWEESLNKALKGVLGWGTSEEELDGLLRRGEWGVDGLCKFVEYFVERGVDPALFEGKLSTLMTAMERQRVSVDDSSLPAPTETSNLESDRPPPPRMQSPELQIVAYKAPAESPPRSPVCPGFHLPIPDGQSPHTSYPFGLHGSLHIPWDYTVRGSRMILQAHACQGRGRNDGSACDSCALLARSPIVRGILDRMNTGTHINTSYAYLGHRELVLALKTKTDQNQYLRFNALNQARTLLRRNEGLSDYKRLVAAISREDIPRVARVIDVALKKKKSVTAVLEKVMEAARGVYKVKSFAERERQLATLLWRLGGDRIGHIVHRALGLPGVNTLRGGTARRPLLPSSGKPKVTEVSQNTLNALQGVLEILEEEAVDVHHAVAMLDEIAVEKRLRHNPRTNKFEGPCRQHGERVSLEFNDMSDMVEVFKAIDDGEIHCASEATIGAIGLLCGESRVYSSRTVLISADCKKESAEEHAEHVLRPLLDGIDSVKNKTAIRIVSLASDGESRRGAAMVLVTFKKKLPEESPIHRHLSPLCLMNLHVGDDDLTCDKDWKHIFKRFRNLLLRERGVLVEHIRITPAIIKEHLREAGKSTEHINSVTNPDDLQDVKLAFDLLYDIWTLPALPSDSSSNPGFRRARVALQLLGRLLYHLVYPYLCIDLSLSEQLEHLSAASHLLFVLYKSAGKDFIPTQLYIDIAIMIKNVFFCVAKAKVDTPDSLFFIILLGTDRLEIHFGILRTVVGNDCNLDILQISERSAGLIDIADILAQRPEWDSGPRRMQLPTLTKDCGEVPKSSDHLSPKYLRGNYKVQLVTLQTCWRVGRSMAEAEYAPTASILQQAEQDKSIDMLSPSGKLLVEAPLAQDDVDESSEAHCLNVEAPAGDAISGIEGETQVDVEDEIQDAELATSQLEDSATIGPTAHSRIEHTILVDGKPVSKAKLLAQYSRYRHKASSADRLKRVQEVHRYTSAQSAQGNTYDIDTNLLLIHDPIATLMYSEGRLWLAVGEVNGLRYDSQVIDRVGHNLLSESAVKVSFQLLGLRLVSGEENVPQQCDWRTYTSPGTCFEIPGIGIEPLDPEFSKAGEQSSYLFASSFLITTTALLIQRIPKANLKSLPRMAATCDYPYRDSNDKCCFLAEVSEADLQTVSNASTSQCTLCKPTVTLDLSDGQRILEHVGCHILFDPAVKRIEEPCGLCLLPPNLCKYFIVRGKGAKASMRVDQERSAGCTRSVNYQYARAATMTKSAPCTNVPLQCPLCPKSEPAVWRYNLEHHLKSVHSPEAAARYSDLWEISDTERTAMKHLWANRKSKKSRKSRKKKDLELTVSAGHTSSVVTASSPGASTGTQGVTLSQMNDAMTIAAEDAERDALDLEDSDSDEQDEDTPEDNIQTWGLEELVSHGDLDTMGVAGGHQEQPALPTDVLADGVSGGVNAEGEPKVDDSGGMEAVEKEPVQGSSEGTSGDVVISGEPTEDGESNLTEVATGRGRRTRKRQIVLDVCLCEEEVDPEDTSKPTVTCTQRGCETRVFHRACVNAPINDKKWKCDACSASAPAKRKKARR